MHSTVIFTYHSVKRRLGIERLIVALITCGSEDEAKNIGDHLVEKHLAACINIAPCNSIFEWKGKLEHKNECLLIVKSVKSRFADIENLVKAVHSYECPEIIAFEISNVSIDYAAWVREMSSSR